MRSKLYLLTAVMLLTLYAQAIVEKDLEHNLFNPPEVEKGSTLTVEDCVSLAFKNSPHIRRKKYELDIANSNVKIAQSRYFPIISANVGFDYIRNSNDIYYDKKYRDLPNVGVAINKMVWDFSKTTSLIKMEKFRKIGAEYEFMDEICHTLFDIKAKYYTLLKMMALTDIAKENVELNKRFSSIANGDIDKITAQVYMNSADSKYINTDGDMITAKINLVNSMYLDNYIDYSIKYTTTFSKEPYLKDFVPFEFPFEKSNAIEIAYKNSPDLAVLQNTKLAMAEALKYSKKAPLPELSAGVGYGLNNTNFTTNNSLQVGVNLSSSANLMELKYDIDSAKAQLNIADNEIDLFKSDLKYEVMRAIGDVECYLEQIPKYKKEVDKSSETLKLAFDKYKNNNLDYTAMHDAIEDYIYAKEKYVNCLYLYNMSLIKTEMAMHYHLIDIHHKAEHAIEHHSAELIEHLNEALNCNKKETRKHK